MPSGKEVLDQIGIDLDKENIKNYILPSFTKKILNSVSQ